MAVLEVTEERKRILQIALSEYIADMMDYSKRGIEQEDYSVCKPCNNAAEIADGILAGIGCELLPHGWDRW